MISGLYASASSMLNGQKTIDIVSGNLANAMIPGHKQERAAFRSFPDILMRTSTPGGEDPRSIGRVGGGAFSDTVRTSFVEGQLVRTGIPTDLAVSGDGFFQLMTPDGIRYTRNGTFGLDGDGFLVASDGRMVMGQNGAVHVGQADFVVRSSGEVAVMEDAGGVVQERIVDQMEIVDFENRDALVRMGNSEFALSDDSGQRPHAAEGTIVQGFLEQSNMNLIEGMVQMIDAMRAYEASQKMLQSIDQTFEKIVNDVAAPQA